MRRPHKKRDPSTEKNSADVKYGSNKDINKIIKMLMRDGKLQKAYNIFSSAITIVVNKKSPKSSDSNNEAIEIFNEIIEKAAPSLEVKTKRVGGANYQVPVEISASRRKAILFRWMIESAKKMVGKMSDNLAKVMLEILDNRGEVLKKKEDLHKMAAANRVFQNIGSRR